MANTSPWLTVTEPLRRLDDGVVFSVTMHYSKAVHDEVCAEMYEMEGDSVSRSELIRDFGTDAVRHLESEAT